jgi:2',3'-cyclic-nucleotide 2'-phosphodiesterase/3'-nucleotidase
VKVGIVGITTPAVPTWEKPENYQGYSFVNARVAAEAAVAELRSKHHADVVLIIAHSGLDRDLPPPAESGLRENITRELAGVRGVDAIVFGHTHNAVESMEIGSVLLTQPKNWAISLARVDLKLESNPSGGYRVVSKSSKLIPVTNGVEADPEILKIAAPYHEMTERFLNKVVAQAARICRPRPAASRIQR